MQMQNQQHQQAENQQRQMQAAMMGPQQQAPRPIVLPDWFAQKIGETEIRHWNETSQLREVIKIQAAKIEELTGINATVGKQLAEVMEKSAAQSAELTKYLNRFGDLESLETWDGEPHGLEDGRRVPATNDPESAA